MKSYYLDSCIWLNYLNKEQTKVQGMPVWKIAEEFLEQYKENTILTKFVRTETLNKVRDKSHIIFLDKYQELNVNPEEMILARKIESKESYTLSFFDCIHIAVCKTREYTLITRDKELIWRGTKYISIRKPEDLIY